jgi:hypothetical protein
MKKFIFLIIIFSVSFAFAQKSAPNYYPLQVGDQWTYKMPIEGTDRDDEQTIRVTEYSDEYKSYIVRTIFKVGDALPITIDDLFEPRGNKVLWLGTSGGLLNSDWSFFSRPVFQTPLKIKSTWRQRDDRNTEYTVISFITLKVEAGTFKNVCKIKKFVKGLDMQSFLYFAPEVGLIKEELINSKDRTTTTFRELTNFKGGKDGSH